MSKLDDIRIAAEADLEVFIRLVYPNWCLGHIHQEIISWWQRDGARSHQLLLIPREHQKSSLVGFRTAHAIIRNPAVRILYISSTSNLAVKQLKFIKDILTCDVVRRYWPDLINREEAKREKWTETEISVDSPLRKESYVREPTIFTAGLTTNVVGLHCDICVLDDVVVNDTAYTDEGRKRLETQYSLLAAVEGSEAQEWVVGTRYHPKDLYNTMLSMKIDNFTETGELVSKEPLYEIFGDGDIKKQWAEDRGDGTGEFLWPRQKAPNGKWFGFDERILARKRGQFLDKIQYRAQYYNDPNDYEGAGIKREYFQYYDQGHLQKTGGSWHYKGNRLNVFAAIDFAFSLRREADYSAICIVGVDAAQNYYILGIDRFKADSISVYFDHIMRMYQKWGFRKLKAEITAAQEVIVKDLKSNYITKFGLALAIEDFRPSRADGAKEERIYAILEPRYKNRQVWHYSGGYCEVLEEELLKLNPEHDDIKDSLATVIDMCIAPASQSFMAPLSNQFSFHPRFGGIA